VQDLKNMYLLVKLGFYLLYSLFLGLIIISFLFILF
jgi:hypothetical protein